MPLSDEEQKILKEIEAQLNATDPGSRRAGLADHAVPALGADDPLGGARLPRRSRAARLHVRREPVGRASIGFAVMLGCLLVIERNVRKLGKAGLASLTGGLARPAAASRGIFGEHGRAWRERFRRDDT